MKRELKFRAWDISDENKGPYILGPYDITDSIFNHKEIRKMQLMQYTGLKDKNGVEIYEGDIVMFLNGFKGVVEFKNGSFEVRGHENKFYFLGELISHLVYEVIGNIHQHLKLL